MPNLELTWQQINCLITDDHIDAAVKQQIENLGVDVLIAATD